MRKWKTNLESFHRTSDSKNGDESVNSNTSSPGIKFRLGERAPRLIHESDVSMCMICWKMFGFGSSRHHCRACGCILCSNCSNHQLPLNYRYVFPYKNTVFLKKSGQNYLFYRNSI